tara:strand:- start:10313 stop:10885 length:573 start_codon:yes stop_codon:yes gene_type:complete
MFIRPFKVIYIALIILFILHYRKYTNFVSHYEIQQQELEYIDGNELYNELNPLIITFIEEISLIENIRKYKLQSLLSFSSVNAMYNTNTSYMSHSNEILLIRPKTQLVIELINPKYKNFFKKELKRDKIFKKYQLDKKNFSRVHAIDIVVREYNILYIPRHWLFKCTLPNQQIEIFTAHNIFTYLFSIIH